MWAEAILQRQDLSLLVGHLLPMTIHLDGARLSLRDPTEISLLPDVGLRVACKADIHWPVLGIEVPVAVNALHVIIRPEIANSSNPPAALVFKLEIEHADLAGLPTFVDNRITERANAALAAKHAEMAWDFVKTLSHTFPISKSLVPIEAIDLGVSDARVKVTSEAVGLAILFKFAVVRHGDPKAKPRTPIHPTAPPEEPRIVGSPERKARSPLLAGNGTAAVAGAFGALVAVGLSVLVRRARRRR
jgi:hypothetical protein